MQTQKILIILFSALLITSCATVTTTTTPNTPNLEAQNVKQPWEKRVKTLSSVQTWDLKALVAIRNMSKNENVTANMQWQQTHKNYAILLYGPMGAGSIKLNGYPGHVTMKTGDGKIINASSPEELLIQQANLRLPVSNLYYWIRGIPVPGMPSQKSFDSYNHLTQLDQQKWRIQYLAYSSVNNVDVPNKIFIFNPELNVKIVINQWNF